MCSLFELGSNFRGPSLRFGVEGLGSWVYGLGFRVWGLWLRVYGLRFGCPEVGVDKYRLRKPENLKWLKRPEKVAFLSPSLESRRRLGGEGAATGTACSKSIRGARGA